MPASCSGGWIDANFSGSALYTAIDRLPRAVGRIVDCVDDRAETQTVSSSADAMTAPATGSPRMVSTSSSLASFPRPMPVSPNPANDWMA